MRFFMIVLTCFMVVASPAWSADPPSEEQNYWPQWRGPQGTGVAPLGDPPVEWSESKNLRWKIELPGRGYATPIVWGDRVFVQSAVITGAGNAAPPSGQSGRRRRGMSIPADQSITFTIQAFDRQSGKELWRHDSREERPHEGRHPTGSWAPNSPVTDGEHVIAYFGSHGIYCYDMEGNLQWEKDLGDMRIKLGFGEGSSAVLSGEKLIINWDHEGQSFITALDKKTGTELWKVDREEATTWATPLVVEHNGKFQVVTSGTHRIRSYDLETGELVWETDGVTPNAIPTPVAANGIVYVTSGFRGAALKAIRLADASGDITNSGAIVWEHGRDTPYVPSPLLFDNMLYLLKGNRGILSCIDAMTGQSYYDEQRLEGISSVYASPVGVGDRVYLTGREGTMLVIKLGQKYEILASNRLEDGFDASPAIVGNEIYLRGHQYLYCIARDE